MKRFILALQFFRDDRATAMRLARLLADIEPKFRDDIEFLFVARFDVDHDPETISYVAEKFTTNWITTHTKWMGWPAGCNGIAKDLLEWVSASRPEAPGLLMIEPDCVPCTADWLTRIMDEWDAAVTAGAWQMGAWRPSGGEHGHVNGNCVIAPECAGAMAGVITEHTAWDCLVAPWVKHRWRLTDLIRNHFESKEATLASFHDREHDEESDIPALLHGYKDDSAYEIARRLCGLEEARK